MQAEILVGGNFLNPLLSGIWKQTTGGGGYIDLPSGSIILANGTFILME